MYKKSSLNLLPCKVPEWIISTKEANYRIMCYQRVTVMLLHYTKHCSLKKTHMLLHISCVRETNYGRLALWAYRIEDVDLHLQMAQLRIDLYLTAWLTSFLFMSNFSCSSVLWQSEPSGIGSIKNSDNSFVKKCLVIELRRRSVELIIHVYLIWWMAFTQTNPNKNTYRGWKFLYTPSQI